MAAHDRRLIPTPTPVPRSTCASRALHWRRYSRRQERCHEPCKVTQHCARRSAVTLAMLLPPDGAWSDAPSRFLQLRLRPSITTGSRKQTFLARYPPLRQASGLLPAFSTDASTILSPQPSGLPRPSPLRTSHIARFAAISATAPTLNVEPSPARRRVAREQGALRRTADRSLRSSPLPAPAPEGERKPAIRAGFHIEADVPPRVLPRAYLGIWTSLPSCLIPHRRIAKAIVRPSACFSLGGTGGEVARVARLPLLLIVRVRSPSIDINIASESKSDAGSWLLAGSLRGKWVRCLRTKCAWGGAVALVFCH